jgi:hypothetical protein
VLWNVSDPDNDPLTAELVSGPSVGQLTFNADGSFTYAPEANYYVDDLQPIRPHFIIHLQNLCNTRCYPGT